MIDSEKIKKISEIYEENRLILIAEILKSKQISYDKENDPIRDFLVENTYKYEDFVGKHRDGPLKHNWWVYGIAEYWKIITDTKFTFYKGKALNLNNKIHICILELAAQCKIGLRHENKILNELTNKTKILLGWIQVKKKFFNK